jgi:transposase
MGPKRIDDRIVLAGIVWCAANNVPFRQAPPVLGVSQATYRTRRLEWRDNGAWPHIVRAVQRNILPGFSKEF